MENASKALIMAGSVLIAIAILSILVLTWQNTTGLPQIQDKQKEAEQIAAFNLEYESYNRGTNILNDWMYGTDMISVVNKAITNNKKYSNEKAYQIEVVVKIQGKSFNYEGIQKNPQDGLDEGTYIFTGTHKEIFDRITSNEDPEAFRSLKLSRGFICSDIQYNQITGRVNKVVFQEATRELFAAGYLRNK